MKKYSIIWGIIGIFIYFALKSYTPITWMETKEFYYFYAGICGFILYLTLRNVSSLKDLKIKDNSKFGKVSLLISIISIPLLLININNEVIKKVEKYNFENFIQNGVITEAKIIKGYHKTEFLGTDIEHQYNLELSFKSKNGEKHQINKAVSSKEFNLAEEGKIINIIYLPTNIETLEIISTQEKLSKYTDYKTRPIKFELITKLLNKDIDSKLSILKEYSFGWHIARIKKEFSLHESNDRYTSFLTNHFTQETLINNEEGVLLYNNKDVGKDFIPKNKIISSNTTNNITIYTTEDINVINDTSDGGNNYYFSKTE